MSEAGLDSFRRQYHAARSLVPAAWSLRQEGVHHCVGQPESKMWYSTINMGLHAIGISQERSQTYRRDLRVSYGIGMARSRAATLPAERGARRRRRRASAGCRRLLSDTLTVNMGLYLHMISE
jgi:hypothetical protein